ncbi:MAG: DUF2721 domain-containing protein, partial [Opitutales bacterium]
MDLSTNPFAVLTVVAAPALLTNSASVLALSTSNRFLRASERMRSLGEQLEEKVLPAHVRKMLFHQVNRVERQSVMLLNALRGIYVAMACFAGSTIISIIGAVRATSPYHVEVEFIITLGFLVGFVGVMSLMYGAYMLFQATRLSLLNIAEEAS